MPAVTVATCQFAVSADPAANGRAVQRWLRRAAGEGADIVHFCEGALSGYAGVDFPTFDGYDWAALDDAAAAVVDAARRAGVWVVVGTAHRLEGGAKPHNSVLVIDRAGVVVDRYDKRFCAGDASETTDELAHFSPGDHPSVFDVDGVRCGVLVCHEYRYPELYRQYMRMGVSLVLHSFHAANASAARLREVADVLGHDLRPHNAGAPTYTLAGITMPASVVAAAAANHLWVSAANSSARESLWPSFVVRADGMAVGRLRRNVAGMLVTRVDTDLELYDSTAAWRHRAMDGVLHSGTLPPKSPPSA